MSEENKTTEQETPVSGHEARHANVEAPAEEKKVEAPVEATDTAPADTTPATDEAKTE